VRRLLTASQRTNTTDGDTARMELLGLARRDGRSWAPRSPLLAVALAEWLHFGMPETDRMTDAAQAVRHIALTRYLSDLKLEQSAAASHAERAVSHTEQVRLQHRANEIADEIARIEAAQSPAVGSAREPTLQCPVPALCGGRRLPQKRLILTRMGRFWVQEIGVPDGSRTHSLLSHSQAL
jgi:hypothetical protein